MGDFTQAQQKYAVTGENCNIEIPVIVYPVKKLTFALKFIIWVLTRPNKMHKNFYRVSIPG